MIHKDLHVWQRSMDLATKIYQLVEDLPKNNGFVLKQQLQKTALSVPSNIAEGAGRTTQKELLRFLDIANGSLTELETQLILVNNLKYSDTSKLIDEDITVIRKMLYKLKRSIRKE
ncbi:four helix bundle protein [Robertkochia marina]|uniref:Four helix bundle protein n=1 Tax=Robertkochia marina TaxID=1227945 RepID=A0A4S3M242_9FLAO|nr:four helix bundle protein [Robertkochia marina]THD67649.1 four helix bundle protein [Robertkochia marina]TRZ43381.1 four helix bundle protein [Robertkochia marina]